MEYSYFTASNFGDVYLSEDKLTCALLIDPSKKKITLKSILWDIKLMFNCIGIFNIGKVLQREKSIKQYHPKEDFIHLWYIGVKKSEQSKGRGTELMRQIIQDYSLKKKPMYLETSMEKNFPFYEKLGFENISEIESVGYPLRMYFKR
jgi:ribosomal protein S18 acetylase RimI-like enzyme